MDHTENILTLDEVVKVAKKITKNNFIQVLDYNLNDYSKEKMGFTGTHHILKIKLQRPGVSHSEIVTAFVKIVSLEIMSELIESTGIENPIIAKESYFFETIVAQFVINYKSEKWCPMHYVTTKNALIMEDLKSEGYYLIDQFVDDLAVLKSVLASLARFHSCSILTEARLSQDLKRPITLNEHYKELCTEMMFVRNGIEARWFSTVTDLTGALAEHLGHDPKKIRAVFDRICDIVMPSKTHQNVICHGDIHYKNIMFADSSSSLRKCTLIDFQTYRYAPLVTDILQFLYLNTTRQFRDQFEAELIRFYHSVLAETIKSNDSTKMVQTPTLEKISKEFEDLRTFGLVMACIYYPIMFMDQKLIEKSTGDSKAQSDFMFGDRTDLTLEHMRVNEFYKKKVEEAINELIERAA